MTMRHELCGLYHLRREKSKTGR